MWGFALYVLFLSAFWARLGSTTLSKAVLDVSPTSTPTVDV